MFKYFNNESFDWKSVLNNKEAQIVESLCEVYSYQYERNCFIPDEFKLTREYTPYPLEDKIDGLFLEIKNKTITGLKMIYWDIGLPYMDNHEIPKVIFELTNLEKLEIRMLFFDYVGEDYYKIDTPLDVKETILKEYMKRPSDFSPSFLPSEIGNLSKLTHLDISGNSYIKELPQELFGLPNLSYLDIGFTGIIPMPKELFDIIKLRSLFISNYHEIALPRENDKLAYVIRQQERDPSIIWTYLLDEYPG